MEKQEFNVLRIKSGNGFKQQLIQDPDGDFHFLELENGENPFAYDDRVIMYKDDYAKIFGDTKNNQPNRKKMLSVVKISTRQGTIYRRFQTLPCMKKGYIALTTSSLTLLGNVTDTKKVAISKTCFFSGSFLYHWNHPYSATRISMRLGVIGVLVGVLGIVASIVL
ncbi:MAG: hypothetical protein MJY52_05135 [Bacteroidaceae bacterium]|nr:hypothetical protein [Bacteroidaceae bacterium]